MLFPKYENNGLPIVILLHGGGLSSWSLAKAAEELRGRFTVITPVLDGHGEDAGTPFVSIEDSAGKLLDYIDRHCGGNVHALGGLSLGAQIAIEALSVRGDIARYAVLESALVLPMRWTAALAAPTYALCYGLLRRRWFARAQAKALLVPEEQFEMYYADSSRMTKQSLLQITKSNGGYALKNGIERIRAKTLILYGEREIGRIKSSAALLHSTLPNSNVYCAEGCRHGELSLARPVEYGRLLCDFIR